MLKRKMYDELMNWKGKPHKPLVIKGQRQVGKTFIVRRFGEKNYKNFIELNLANDDRISKIFEKNLDIDRISDEITLISGKNMEKKSTLLFLDEIQESQLARSALKVFAEDGHFDVIASGSMLGISDARLGKYSAGGIPPLLPVGYEEHKTMYSMDFEEFLWAMKCPPGLIERTKLCIREGKPIGDTELDYLNENFRKFMVVGGMPAAVKAFVSDGMGAADRILNDIISTCKNDISRYCTGADILKTSECFDAIPGQLSGSNKKFMYSEIDGNKPRTSKMKYGGNLLWIKESGFGNFCYGLTAPERPLEKNVNRDNFKVYMSDTGLLMHMMSDASRYAAYKGDTSYNFGAVAENIVCECLVKNGLHPSYYRKSNGDNKMELDFITELGIELAAIEVKSGKKREYPSLRKAAGIFGFDRKIILENGNISIDSDDFEHYPLFASAFIREIENRYEIT